MKDFIHKHNETIKFGLLTTLICYIANIVFTVLLIPIISKILSLAIDILIIVDSYVLAKYILTKTTSINWSQALIIGTCVYFLTSLLTSILPLDTIIWLIALIFHAFVMEK